MALILICCALSLDGAIGIIGEILATKDKLPGRDLSRRNLDTIARVKRARRTIPCQTENSRRTNIATLEIFYTRVIRRTYIRATFLTSYNARARVRVLYPPSKIISLTVIPLTSAML